MLRMRFSCFLREHKRKPPDLLSPVNQFQLTPESSLRITDFDLHNIENRIIRPALKGSAINWTGFHGFRRGLATNLFALGVNPKIIAAILRHAGMAMTLKHYTMIPDAEQREALAKL